MQEHEYKARDKTVQKMSRDGLREKNLRSKKEKRITGREADEKKTAGHREQELDFGKVRKTHTAEETVEGVKEGKHRLQSRHAFLEQEEIAEAEEMENSEMSDDKAGGEKSPSVSRSRLRKESIRGHPERKFERDSEITEPDRQNRKKKMVTAYAAKEQKRYHEKSEVDEKSMEDFREEIKDKTKREQTLKEQKKSKSRLSFEDESKGMIPGSGMARKGATVVSETVSAYGQKKIREGTDDNAALDAANQMELAGESLARKSIYVRERLKEKRQRNNRLRESVLEETEKSRLQFGTSVSNEAKRAVQKEAEQKKQSALKKLLQKKRYQKQYQAAKQGKAVKDAVLVNAQRFTEKAKAAVKELVAQNRNILLSIGVLVLLFALMATSLSSCAALFQGSSNAIISTSYSSEDEDIYAAENAYVALENALNEQINQMKANHSDYDEFQFQIDEIGHNPYQLISYLTVKYGGFTYAEVADEIQEIFREQYGLYTDSTRETVTEKKTVRVGESLGQVVTSGYCNCPICCGQWSGGPTASGAYPQANHTIAVDASNPFVPMGTHVIMNGVEYVVEDTGNFAQYGVQFDVFYGGHASASAHGHQTWEAYMTLASVKAEKSTHYTSPPKMFTEDTLLAAMETAGNKEFDSETEKKGLGTPATRANIIEKLVSSGYAERKGKQILPTVAGCELIHVMPENLKSAGLTAEWENQLLMMEKGEIQEDEFMNGIVSMINEILSMCRAISEEERNRFQIAKEVIGKCPVCGSDVYEGKTNYYCSDRSCQFALWKSNRFLESMKKSMDKKMAVELLKNGRTHVKGLYSKKKDSKFDADLVLGLEDGKARFSLEFPKKKK